MHLGLVELLRYNAWANDTLLAACPEFVDEMNLFTYPVVLGRGTRLFSETGADMSLGLFRPQPTATGITMQVSRVTGRPR
jgi:hypothetical protein